MFVVWYAHAQPGVPRLAVAGLSLVQRAALCASAAGFARVCVVVHGEDRDAVERDLAGDRRLPADLRVVEPSAALGSMAAISGDEEAALALGDRVWPTALTRQIAAPLVGGARLRVLSGSAADGAGADAGLYRSKIAVLAAADLPTARSETEIGQALARAAGGEESLERVSIGPAWKAVRAAADVGSAEGLLLDSLKKETDGIVSRNINRKISLFLSRRLARTRVSPNQITALVFLVGACSGPFAFFLHGYWGFALGAFCYYLSAILDGCDGEISRLKFQGSALGAWLDTVVDDIVCLSYLLGVYGRFAVDTGHPFWIALGIGGLAFYLLTILPRYWVMATRLGSGNYQQLAKEIRPEAGGALKRAALAIRDVIFRTDFLPFYAFVTALCDCVPAFAVPFAFGSVASSIDTLMTIARTGRDAPSPR